MVYDTLRLYIGEDNYIFEPVLEEDSRLKQQSSCLTINRCTGEFMLAEHPGPTITREAILVVYGIIGIIRLHTGTRKVFYLMFEENYLFLFRRTLFTYYYGSRKNSKCHLENHQNPGS